MGAPVVTTYIRAIKNNWLSTFLGLTVKAVQQHLPKMLQTTMGHQHRLQKNICSTKKVTTKMMMNKTEEKPTLDPPCKIYDHQHNVEITTLKFQELQGMISTNQTGQFPIISGQRNTTTMFMYDHNSNVINATPIKSTKWNTLINGYNKIYNNLRKVGIIPVMS